MTGIPIEHDVIKLAAPLVDLKIPDMDIEHCVENARCRSTMETVEGEPQWLTKTS